MEKMIEAARWAMSGANGQPWEFIVVKDSETRKKIVALYDSIQIDKWNVEKTRIEEVRHQGFAKPPAGSAGFKDAPVLIVVCGDPRTYQATVLTANFIHGEGGVMATYLKNMSNATQNLHLAAAALGLGSQWVSVSRNWGEPMKTLLGVQVELDIHTVVLVGYPAQEPRPAWRRPFREIVHYDKYDQSKRRSSEDIFQYLIALRRR